MCMYNYILNHINVFKISKLNIDSWGFWDLHVPRCVVRILASDDASDDLNCKVPVEGIMEKRTILIQRHKGNYDSQGVFETNNFFGSKCND